jgi:EpsD family peptidyl-prolyl cis-trans isomerase
MNARKVAVVVLAALPLFLNGCEKPVPKTESAVVAKIGADTVSEAELNFALSRQGKSGGDPTRADRNRTLETLIDLHLVDKAAREARLDKEPGVVAAIAQAERQILAGAYAENRFKNLAKPSDEEIAAYFNKHPELFSQRKLFRIQELDLEVGHERLAEIEAQLKQTHALGDFAAWLKQQGIHGTSAVAVKASDQVSPELLSRLLQMKDGQVSIQMGRSGHVLVDMLQGSQLQPVTLEQARAAIERFLIAEKRKQTLDGEIKKLRESNKVEYSAGYGPAAAPPNKP